MKLGVPKEIVEGERRVSLVPESVRRLTKAGLEVIVERGAGAAAWIGDDAFGDAGASVEPDPRRLLESVDFVVKVQPPVVNVSLGAHEASLLKPGSILLTTLRPMLSLATVRLLASGRVTSFSTDSIPRTTRAQSMDTLSSQASVAGYRAVLIAASAHGKFFPMMMTAAGTVFATKVFVIGAGVAGLQAAATAKRLGAMVEATDTRAAVREQVESLGAKFVGVEGVEDAQDARGYARELSAEFQTKQAALIRDRCSANDVVITTALIGGVKAPKLIDEGVVKGMKPGSVIVDLAAEAGGNCTLTEPGRTVERHGVILCGPTNLPSEMPIHASQMYSRNVTAFVLEFWKEGAFRIDRDDEIIKGAMITHDGAVTHAGVAKALEQMGSGA